MVERALADEAVFVQGEPVASYPLRPLGVDEATPLRITVVGEPVLHERCQEITEFGTPQLAELINDMFLTMYVADGCGLAANQVGLSMRLFVYDCRDDDGVRHVGHVLNPTIEEADLADRKLVGADEGCLSVPGGDADLVRSDKAVVRGVDMDGKPITVRGTGYFARCLLHETDHLNGQLYIDRLSKRDRKRALQKMDDRAEDVFARREANAAALNKTIITADEAGFSTT